MKKAPIKNLGLKLLAFICSIVLWFIVVNLSDPVDKKVFTGIQVSVTHSEIVTNQGNTFQIVDGSNVVNVTVKAQRSILEKIKSEDIKATADMRNIVSGTRSQIPISVSIPAYAGSKYEAQATPNNLQVNIEAGKSETFPITATSTGTPRDGYEPGELKANPEKVKISGPESIIDSIDRVEAKVNISGLSKDTELPAEMVLYDAAGGVIDSTQIEHNLGEEGLSVLVKLLHTKTVPVEFDTSMIQPAEGYHFSGISLEPASVRIVGAEKDLETVDVIRVPAEELAEAGLTESIEKTVDITPYLPSWVKTNENASVPIVVKISIEKFGTKTIEFPISSISLVNVPKGFKVTYQELGNIPIVVTGAREDLDSFSLEKGSVSMDLIDCKEAGEYSVPLKVNLPEGMELEKAITVPITLAKSDGGSDDQ